MKKLLVFIYITVLITIFFLNTSSVFAVSCRQNGNTTYCDDGTTYRQNGNTVYGSDGTTYRQNGNTIYSNDGSTFRQNGNTTYGSNGVNCTQNGNKMFCSDGSSYFTNGNTTYGTGGNVFNSCPTNSSYDSSSGKCQCDYGYKVDGSSCVYSYSNNNSNVTPMPTYTTNPIDPPSNQTVPTDSNSDSSSGGWSTIVAVVGGFLIIKWLVSIYEKGKPYK